MNMKKNIMIVMLVAICVASTMAIRDEMATVWARALVAGLGGAVIGLVAILGHIRNQTKEK